MLAIDTATRFAGLSLYDGSMVRAEMYWLSNNNHSVELTPALARLLEQQGLEPQKLSAVAVSTGPGSFTGLRIGMSVAKGLAQACKIPIFGVSTLDVLCFQHDQQRRPIWAVIQAGRGRLCAARYERRRGRWQRRGEIRLLTLPDLAAVLQDGDLVCGELEQDEIVDLRARRPADVVFASPAMAMRRPACLAEMAWARFGQGEQDDLATLSPVYLQDLKS